MGYENEDDFFVGLRNHFAIFGWAAKFYLKILNFPSSPLLAIINDRSLNGQKISCNVFFFMSELNKSFLDHEHFNNIKDLEDVKL